MCKFKLCHMSTAYDKSITVAYGSPKGIIMIDNTSVNLLFSIIFYEKYKDGLF